MRSEELQLTMPQEERAVSRLLHDAHLAADFELPALFEEHALALGVRDAVVYLADLQQRRLVPFVEPGGAGADTGIEPLVVDASLGGRAFQHVQVVTQSLDAAEPTARVWLPLLDGAERLGVLAVTTARAEDLDAHHGALRGRLLRFASLAAELIMTKALYGDTLVRLRRTRQMTLAAEMQWSLLPPLTFANPRVLVAGALEPAYQVAGDTLDYAVEPDRTHVAIFDGMGHGLRSAQLAALAVAAYRNGRREGQALEGTAQGVDTAVASAFDDAFLTGQVAELDTSSGRLSWVNAGHPEPLLLRAGRLVKALQVEPTLPFGLGGLVDDTADVPVGAETLEPDDIVLFYSDGVVEARSPGGDFFGSERLVDLVVRNLAAGLPAPETMRRVIHALLDHQQGQLDDDASLLFVQYRPAHAASLVP